MTFLRRKRADWLEGEVRELEVGQLNLRGVQVRQTQTELSVDHVDDLVRATRVDPRGANKIIDMVNAQFGLGLPHLHTPKVELPNFQLPNLPF